MAKIKNRVDATRDKLALLQEMKGMIHTLKSFAARIDEKINVMLEADLQSMEAEKKAIEEMETQIKGNESKG